jgi:rhamnulokinase
VGGRSRNDLLNRFATKACNLPVIAGPVEATAYGNLMVQVVAAGELSNIASDREAVAASVERRRFEPRAPNAWDEPYQRFLSVVG